MADRANCGKMGTGKYVGGGHHMLGLQKRLMLLKPVHSQR